MTDYHRCIACGAQLVAQATINGGDGGDWVCLSEQCADVNGWRATDARVKQALQRLEHADGR